MKTAAAGFAVLLAASPLAAQNPATVPGLERREIVAVFVSMRSCCETLTDSVREPLALIRRQLADQAMRQGAQFRMVGVALDWTPEEGWDYLKSVGRFDEISVGSNWRNGQAELLMWADSTAQPAVPQLVVYEHTVGTTATKMTFGPRRTLKVVAARDLGPWARSGAPLR